MSKSGHPPLVAGKYHIRDRLGEGAHGTVYRATHVDLGEDVALKILHHDLARDEKTQRRFLREVKLATSFVHKYAVQLRDFGREPDLGCLYFTMDLVEGHTLADIYEREGPLEERQGIHLTCQLLEALEEAHRAGIVHRDLKPANLIVTTGPDRVSEIRVLDFGVAKAVSKANQADLEQSALTVTGALVGTVQYMSPEQAQGMEVDARSDLYSVGVLLYEALCGQQPTLPNPNAENMLQSFLYRLTTVAPKPLRRMAPHITHELEAVVMKALKKRPSDRFASAREMRKALKRVPATKARKRAQRARKGAGAEPPPRTRSDRHTPIGPHATLDAATTPSRRPPSSSLRREGETSRARQPTERSKRKEQLTERSKRKEQPTERQRRPAHQRSSGSRKAPRIKSHSKRSRKAGTLPAGVAPGPRKGEFVNERDGSILLWLPPGTYVRGADHSGPGRVSGILGVRNRLAARDHPAHEVCLTRGVFVGKTAVTWKQFRRFCMKTGRRPPTKVDFKKTGELSITDRHPAVNLSWRDAQAYCRWAKLRLPSEAEWEFAARGADGRLFPWGNTPPSPKLLNWAGHPTFGKKATNPVGGFPLGASPCGCLDMVGNVWEWVADWYADYRAGARSDPEGPSEGKARVIRGGCWQSKADHCLASRRFALPPDARRNSVGFRVCRSG